MSEPTEVPVSFQPSAGDEYAWIDPEPLAAWARQWQGWLVDASSGRAVPVVVQASDLPLAQAGTEPLPEVAAGDQLHLVCVAAGAPSVAVDAGHVVHDAGVAMGAGVLYGECTCGWRGPLHYITDHGISRQASAADVLAHLAAVTT